MDGVIDRIKTRGYWKVIIRPSDFRRDRIPDFQTLKHIITKSSVSLRGWSFPHVSTKTDIQIGLDWVQQWVEWSDHVEAWRLYQSGQFVFYGSIRDDWWDQSFWRRPGEDRKPGAILSVIDVVYRIAEIFEFAARLAMTEGGSETMTICITLVGLKERQLWFQDQWGEGFDYPRIAHIASFPQTFSVSRQELVADPRLLALKASREVFIRFDWTPSIEGLREVQKKLGR